MLHSDEGRLRLGWRLFLFLALMVALAIAAGLVHLPGIPGATLPLLAAALVAGWVMLALDGRKPGALGFHLSRAAPLETMAGLGVGIAVSLGTVLLMAVAGGVRWELTEGSPTAFLVGGMGALWLFTIPAFAEEALFRGYPFQALAEAWGAGLTLLVTSVGFSLVHMANPNVTGLGLVNIFAAGVFLGAIYLRTASLWWASGAHLGWNWALGFLVAVPVSGLELVDNPYLEATKHGPDWVSGGAFGPEGSIFAAVALLGASAFVWRSQRVRPEQFGPGALEEPLLWRGGRSGAAAGDRLETGEESGPDRE